MCMGIDIGIDESQILQILPNNKRLKQLINSFGEQWEILKYQKNVQCLPCPGYYIKSLNGIHERWVEEDNVKCS